MNGMDLIQNILILLQIMGIVVPLIGIVVLLGKEQNKASAFLMLADVSCLIVNICYYMILTSNNGMEATIALKIEYFGNAIFYFFFLCFVVSYLGLTCPKLVYIGWVIFETIEIAILWQDNYRGMVFLDMNLRENEKMGINYLQLEGGTLYTIKYGVIASLLLILLAYTIVRFIRAKAKSERHNLLDLVVVQGIVLVALYTSVAVDMPYDIIPICTSFVIFNIILSVIKGEIFNITNRGRTWAFEHVDNGLIIVDSAYGYLDSNMFADKIFPELKKMGKNAIIPDELLEIFMKDEKTIEYKGRHYVKSIKKLKMKKKHRKNVYQETEGYCLVLTDVSEQCRMMDELSEAKEMAESANKAKSTFISNMSHEIRTPMNAIVGMTEILLRSDLREQERGYLMNIKNSGNALLNIINDILDFSKIESGKMTIVEEDYEPMSMFSDLSMIFLTRIGEKDIELLYDIDKELPAKLYGDSLRLRQIIINIANNAIKFTEQGYVKLTVKVNSKDENSIELFFSIKDTGIGIRQEDIGKLFGSFQQVDEKKNHNKEGTGLGLSISKQLVELMGGTIDVRSTYGEGSEFFFTVRQKIVDTNNAAQIKDENLIENGLVISGYSENKYVIEGLKNLCDNYGCQFVDYYEACEKKIIADYFFSDSEKIREQLRQYVEDNGREQHICILQNPMKESFRENYAIAVNKPLYTLNFCQVINHEKQGAFAGRDDFMSFTVPDAHILIVDDNEMNLKVATGLLQPCEMHIDTAESGMEALKLIKEKHYDIIFMDHMMPVMDGIETTKKLRSMDGEYFKTVPIIALTANAVVGAKEQFIEAGMNDFVAKPIEMKHICAKLKTWLPGEYIRKTTERIVEQKKHEEDEIAPIVGINIQEGIKYSGTKELFLSLLGDFYKLIDMKSEKIEKCLADGMIRDYTVEVHALKNTARMIGASRLSERFYRLEQYGNAENMEALIKETPEVMEMYRSYKEPLRPYASMQEQEKTEVDNEKLIYILETIRSAMDSFDIDGADAAFKELENYRIPVECESYLDELRAYMADVAMENVLEITEKMIDILKNKNS